VGPDLLFVRGRRASQGVGVLGVFCSRFSTVMKLLFFLVLVHAFLSFFCMPPLGPHSDSMGPITYHFCFTQHMLNMGHKIIQKVEKKKRLKFSILKIVFPIALWLKVTRAHVVVGQLSKIKYQTMA
jgi:hypothetical protein